VIGFLKRLARVATRVFIRLWIGDPRSPYEKIVFDASRQVARQFGGAA
jgi:hypothetical protein